MPRGSLDLDEDELIALQTVQTAAAAGAGAAAESLHDRTASYLSRQRPIEEGGESINNYEEGPARVNDYSHGEDLVTWLFEHPEVLYNVTRLTYRSFIKLALWLKEEAHVQPGRGISIEQKMVIFFKICGHGNTYRDLASQFRHSIGTISKIFYEVLKGLEALHPLLVRLPSEEELRSGAYKKGRLADPTVSHKFRHFNKCIGALDGTHIKVHVSAGPRSIKWLNRKGYYSQNVLACVDLDGRFQYVLAGYEGRAHDGVVLQKAREIDGFRAPAGFFFAADAGYSGRRFDDLMVPYMKVRYHLLEQAAAKCKPETPRELYNLRHAVLRNVVERVFGVFKRRWRSFNTAREFPLSTQIRLIYALMAVSNWIFDYDNFDHQKLLKEVEEQTAQRALRQLDETVVKDEARLEAALLDYRALDDYQEALEVAGLTGRSEIMEKWRDRLTDSMWNDYRRWELDFLGGLRVATDKGNRGRRRAIQVEETDEDSSTEGGS